MKKTVVTLLHIGYWFCYLILILVILGVLFGDDGAVSETKIEKAFHTLVYFVLIPSAITFYLFYGVLFSRYLQQRKFVLTACYGALTALASAIIGYCLLEWIIISQDRSCWGENDTEVTRLGVILFMTFIAAISGIIAFVIKGFITWVEEVKLKEELKLKNREMELALVKSQLDPHFLFNTINNIDVLILRDATQASDYLNKLSDIMRFMLFETKTEHILLAKEIEYINKYIDLQKIRTANSSYVNFEVSGKVNGQLMAPMVFIPFIENAFKHTNNKKIPQAIDIKIETSTTHTQLICSNKFDPTHKLQQQNYGLGNELIKRRLQLLYPDKHVLEVSNNHQVYHVILTIEHG
ncbi:MAG: histidine kinase [Bacteroidota bacterium]